MAACGEEDFLIASGYTERKEAIALRPCYTGLTLTESSTERTQPRTATDSVDVAARMVRRSVDTEWIAYIRLILT